MPPDNFVPGPLACPQVGLELQPRAQAGLELEPHVRARAEACKPR